MWTDDIVKAAAENRRLRKKTGYSRIESTKRSLPSILQRCNTDKDVINYVESGDI